MRWLRFKGLLQRDGWLSPAFVQIDAQGNLAQLSTEPPLGAVEVIDGYAVPGFQNCHSHSFQYAMAGLAEHLGPDQSMDDFWSWREAMYDLALKVNPEDAEAIATQVYAEMLARGYTSVVEFHYLHKDPSGNAYDNPSEMAERHIVAALRTGIRLTIVPIYYKQGDFGLAASMKQRRFLSSSPDDYFSLCDSIKSSIRKAQANIPERIRFGQGVHSLRAASSADIKTIVGNRDSNTPFHMHVAEQAKEVNACYHFLKKRPVEWLLENTPLDSDFSLVHCTHMTTAEIAGLAKSKAIAVICPSTEGNLGDGFFHFESYLRQKGNWAIGTDSHIGLSPMEELRWLDYGQRLRSQKRNSICFAPNEDSGTKLFHESLEFGRLSGGHRTAEYFALGKPFDAAVFDSPLLHASSLPRLLSTLVFSCDSSSISHVFVAGKSLVERGRHQQETAIRSEFLSALSRLATR